MLWKKIFLIILIVSIPVTMKLYGFDEFFTLEFLKEKQWQLQSLYQQNPLGLIALFSSTYLLVTALSLPGAAILTLAAGAIFGFSMGLPLVSISSTFGATLAFLVSRFLLRSRIEKMFSRQLDTINRGIDREGGFYLFTLRLIPVFPFFLVNMLTGLTRMKITPFFFISLVGMLPGTVLYVNAGQHLSRIQTPGDVLSLPLFLSLALLGILPLVAKRIVENIRIRRCYRRFKKPSRFDYNMIVIGGGSAGLVTSYLCASLRAKVALIEKNKMGGDCLNTGCVPSKALLKSASLIAMAKQSQKYGIEKMETTFKFTQIMERVRNTIKKIEPHDSIDRYKSLGVDCFAGKAEILSPWEVRINNKVLTTTHITIATGATPSIPPLAGIKNIDFLTSDTIWNLEELPKNLLIMGAGAIAVEMAQAFCRLGSTVTIIQRSSRILSREDDDVAKELERQLLEEGVSILTDHTPLRFENNHLIAQNKKNESVSLSFDKILVATGRTPRLKGFGLEELGIELRQDGSIKADPWMRTNFPNIWVCGDVTGPFRFTHTAAHQAWYCSVNALFGRFKKFKVDYSAVPRAIYTNPEIAVVGKNEKECQSEKIDYETTKYHLCDLDRAITDSEDRGFVKVLTRPGTDKIIGATIVGSHAGELILEFVTAMKHNFGLGAILGTIHPYPTLGEANKYLAGHWRKAHKPERLLKIIEKYHSWVRGKP